MPDENYEGENSLLPNGSEEDLKHFGNQIITIEIQHDDTWPHLCNRLENIYPAGKWRTVHIIQPSENAHNQLENFLHNRKTTTTTTTTFLVSGWERNCKRESVCVLLLTRIKTHCHNEEDKYYLQAIITVRCIGCNNSHDFTDTECHEHPNILIFMTQQSWVHQRIWTSLHSKDCARWRWLLHIFKHACSLLCTSYSSKNHQQIEQPHWCTVQQIWDEEKSKHAGLAQQNSLAQHFCTWCCGSWQKGAAKPNTCCCWLARWFDWSRWVAIT